MTYRRLLNICASELLDKLFHIWVNGKMWCLLKSWYDGHVKVDGSLSERYPAERGCKIRLGTITCTFFAGDEPTP